MNCHKARSWFSAYWDDEITQAERECLEAHFAGCERCRGDYEALARTIEGVATLPRAEAAPDFVERTLARARRATPVADRFAAPRPVWVPLAAAASLVLVSVSLLSPWAGREVPGLASRRAVPQEARAVAPSTPVTATSSPGALASGATVTPRVVSQEQMAALVDSLIDHSADVDFVIDPVRVSRERTAGRRVETVQGQQAVISF